MLVSEPKLFNCTGHHWSEGLQYAPWTSPSPEPVVLLFSTDTDITLFYPH